MRITKKAVSIILAMLMVATMMSVMAVSASAAGAVAEVNGTQYDTLQAALTDAPSGSTVTLLADINEPSASFEGGNRTYGIKGKSKLTIDGDGHTVTISNSSAIRGFGIWYDVAGEGADITFKDITINNSMKDGRAIDTRGSNLASLTLDNVTLNCTGGAYAQALTIGGNQSKVMDLNIINNSKIYSPQYYAIITFNPVNATITDSELSGYACIYAKGKDGSAGSANSVYNISNSKLTSINRASASASNTFGMITVLDKNIVVNITDTEIHIEGNNNRQSIICATTYALTGNELNLGEGNDVVLADDKAEFAINCINNYGGADIEISGGTFTQPIPVEYCAEDYYPVSDGSGNYTVDSIDNHEKSIIVDGDPFGIDDTNIRSGQILGVQLKSNIADAAYTSQNGQENGRDLRFVTAVDTELLKAADDYGFVIAKVGNYTDNNLTRTIYNTKLYNLNYNGGNGEKTVSAKDTKNNIAGGTYGDPTDDSTEYKFVTCAVNSIEKNKMIAVRFYVVLNGKVHYLTYNTPGYTFAGCLAGIDLSGNVY